MLMKIFNKGQVVIPVALRRELGVEPGDLMEVVLDEQEHCIKLRKHQVKETASLAGTLSKYNKREKFPSKAEMRKALAEGLSNEG